MAVLLVPSQYGTISAAITAASANDTIVVSAGTYAEHLNFGGKDGLFLAAAQNETVTITCTLSGGKAVNLDNCRYTTIRGFNFVLSGSTMGDILGGNTTRGIRAIECTFDISAVTGSSGSVYLINLPDSEQHSESAPSYVSRCTFIGAGTSYSAAGAIAIGRSAGTMAAIVEGCLFRNFKATVGLVRLFSATSGTSALFARHNTVVSCYLEKAAFNVDMATTDGKAYIYNNIVDETTIASPSSTTETFNVVVGGGGSGLIRNCTYYPGSAGTTLTDAQAFTASYSNATNTIGTDPAVDTTTGRITPTSGVYRTGVSVVSAETRAYIGRDRHAFATTPSRGCFEAYPSGTQVLHVKHAYADPIIGFALSGVTLGTPYRNRFDDPFDLAEYLERAITVGTTSAIGLSGTLHEVWYDLGLQAYRIGRYSGTLSLVTSSTAGYIMGSVSTGTVSVATLDQDRQTLQLSYALDEDPVGEEDQAFVYLSDSGHAYGEVNPSGSYRRTFKFNALSTNENLVYDQFTGAADPLWRLVLNKYFAGAEMRVYRAWGYDMDPFDPETNSDGYTDMVPIDLNPANYNWNDSAMRRFDAVLEGVQA